MATKIFLGIVQKQDFPELITSYLHLDHTFLVSYNHSFPFTALIAIHHGIQTLCKTRV